MRSRRPLAAACGLVLLMGAVAAPAQHGPAEPSGPTAVAEVPPSDHQPAHEQQPKPALLQYDPGATIWSIIVFVTLLLLLRASAWKPILRVLKQREEFIRKSIEDARQERLEAQRLLAEYQARLDRAREEASAIVAEGRRDAEVEARRIQEQARRQSEEILDRARREIQLAADTARKELHDQACELAVEVAARIISKTLSPADHRELVAESLKLIEAAGQARMN